jgi:hypothetical protein
MRRDVEALGDLFVGEPFPDEVDHLVFAFGQAHRVCAIP